MKTKSRAKKFGIILGLLGIILAVCCGIILLIPSTDSSSPAGQSGQVVPLQEAVIVPTDTPAPTEIPATATIIPTEPSEPEPTDTASAAQSAPVETSTDTPVPATETSVPTDTPIPATATPIPATDTPIPAPPSGPRLTIIRVNKGAEYVDIQNIGDQPQDLSGWRLFSERGAQDCPLCGQIGPGETLRIWAMASDAGQGGFNCGFGSNIWNNNDPDLAVLFDAVGQVVDQR